MGITVRPGDRIKLLRGDIIDPKKLATPDNCYPHLLAIAGLVPVGSVGTVCEVKHWPYTYPSLLAVAWDGMQAATGYYWGLGGNNLDDTKYEIVGHVEPPPCVQWDDSKERRKAEDEKKAK